MLLRLFAIALVGCGAENASSEHVTIAAPSASAVTIATPTPSAPTMHAFIEAGCHATRDGELDCTKSSIPGVDACRGSLTHVDVTFDPPAWVAECHADVDKVSPGVRTVGCKLQSHVVLFAATSRAILRIASKADLVAAFAPVTTGDEAIAFAEVLTDDDAYVKPVKVDDGSFVSTRVTRDGERFRFQLFRSTNCGCDHPFSAVDYEVARDGTVTELRHAIVRQNTEASGMCKD